MSHTFELAERKDIRAFRLGDRLLIAANGDNPTPGFAVDIQPSLLKIFPQQFLLVRRPLPGIFPQVVTPYRYSEIVLYPADQPTVKVHHAEGADDVTIEELSEQTTVLPLPTADRRIGPDGADEAIGFSPNLSFDEAFADALAALPELDGNTADQLQNIEVLETGARIGGIVGFHHLFVRIARTVS